MFIKLPIFDKHLYGEDFASNLRKNIKSTCKFSKKRVINRLMKFWELWKLIWRKMEKWVQVKASSQWVLPILAEDYRYILFLINWIDSKYSFQKVYMQYPLRGNDNTWFPVNYCAAGYNKPWLKKLLAPFCIDDSPRNPLNGKVPPAKPFCDPQGRTRRDTNCPRQNDRNPSA